MKLLFNLRQTGLLTVAATTLLTACQKETKPAPTPDPQPTAATKLKKVSDGSSQFEFTYNADGTVQTLKSNDDLTTGGTLTTFTVLYTADKKISELKATGGPRIVAGYTGAELTSAQLYDDAGDLALTTRYQYENGLLKAAIGSVSGMDMLKFAFAYDAAGNPTRTTVYSITASGALAVDGHTDYTYDAKANPLAAHKTLFYLLLQNISKNNVTKEMAYDENNALTETTEYTYTYNNQNLPQSAAVKSTQTGQPSTNSTLQYTYQ